MKPYYEHAGITIYHGDCREILPSLPACDLVLTDPPYGISDARNDGKRKGRYESELWEDSPEYVAKVVVPTLIELMARTSRCVLTPGEANIYRYPPPAHVGAFYYPASNSVSCWGMRLWQPIFFYGSDPYAGRLKPDGKICYDSDRTGDHPCPKPLKSWSWLLARVSLEEESVIDPFAGSGTTLHAAKLLRRRAIGIEIEEKYCEIAAKRLSQEVLNFEETKV